MKKNKDEPIKVYCSDCRWFKRDTDGISFSLATGEYFLGKCTTKSNESKAETRGKLFADKPRICVLFSAK